MDSSLIYGLATLGAGLLALLIRYGFKSKCTEISLCFGLVHVQRDIEQEVEEEKRENSHVERQRSNELARL
jgi:hypothetical protein